MQDSMTVSELNRYAKNLIENDILLQMVNVSGEISNYKRHSSGHIYFTLKDEKSKINCSFFKNYNSALKFEPENGMFVKVAATVSIYERDGAYQLYVYKMAKEGTGRLHELFEELKIKLSEEGLFDLDIKKPIPAFPKRIAVLASPTGAAVRDIISVTGRRAENVEIVIVPVPVQGEGAARQIASALSYADNKLDADTIIIARGGGSIEELWAFNEEILARAIYNCKTPVISGVGHETDFTICDFVADMRAPTPSAAAEISVKNCSDIKYTLEDVMKDIRDTLDYKFASVRQKIDATMNSAVMNSSIHKIEMQRQHTDRAYDNIFQCINQIINQKKSRADAFYAAINAMNPYNVLSRGYSVAKKNEKTIINAEDVNVGDNIYVKLYNGGLECTVNSIDK